MWSKILLHFNIRRFFHCCPIQCKASTKLREKNWNNIFGSLILYNIYLVDIISCNTLTHSLAHSQTRTLIESERKIVEKTQPNPYTYIEALVYIYTGTCNTFIQWSCQYTYCWKSERPPAQAVVQYSNVLCSNSTISCHMPSHHRTFPQHHSPFSFSSFDLLPHFFSSLCRFKKIHAGVYVRCVHTFFNSNPKRRKKLNCVYVPLRG